MGMPAGWFVAGLLHLRLRVQPRPKSVDFHDAENRQRPCRILIRHVKNPLSACLAWVLSAKFNPSIGSHCQSSVPPSRKKTERPNYLRRLVSAYRVSYSKEIPASGECTRGL
ncbi:ras-specific guanine nucleotide-releasing factor RalGPS2 [Trichonephila clavipes]|nr:ras-specific guanine nucleotide-releasing factor RalGPS2 [Trichonephila clavipes]